ncbi:Short-chain dehydrogenase/reductase family protein [Mycena sanguinolenta]|uniref:Short-chain dehydrogenase/reductase family protein n=1 Tax=Mycena sanguinolenta TaxID=230812 RepID=A0A8H6XIE3_9AGAR|nr:Short-chain dehydrogenase/reductase family protein [Mycena sanguinolenta]
MGSLLALMSPSSFLPERDIPDLSGKIAIVTGGNTGIGYHTVEQLLLKNAKVYVAARSRERAEAAIKALEKETKKKAIFLQIDLSDLASVRKAAETFLAQESKLDILINNGGVMISPTDQLTAQGHDQQFGTNCIGHFYFTELLLPALIQSHKETGVRARIVNVSSVAHSFAPGNGMEFSTLKGGAERDAWIKKAGRMKAPWGLYGESKIGNIFIANYWAREHSDAIVSCSVHPGRIKSGVRRNAPGPIMVIGNFLSYPTPMGAYTQLWGATVGKPEEINGKYLVPWAQVGKPDPRAENRQLEDEVIAYVKEQITAFTEENK